MKKSIKNLFLTALFLCTLSLSFPTAFAADIPYGAGGFCWGASPDEMPDLTFLDSGRKTESAPLMLLYQANNVNSYNLGDYLPDNIKPQRILVRFREDSGYVGMSLEDIDAKHFEAVFSYLTKAYGQSTSHITKFQTPSTLRNEKWKSDNTEIMISISSISKTFFLQIHQRK